MIKELEHFSQIVLAGSMLISKLMRLATDGSHSNGVYR